MPPRGAEDAVPRFNEVVEESGSPTMQIPCGESSPHTCHLVLRGAPRGCFRNSVGGQKWQTFKPMGSDFTNFDPGCHGPVPLETVICSEDAAIHSMVSSQPFVGEPSS